MRVRRLVTLGDSVLDSFRYSGGPGTSPPDLLARELGAELHPIARDGHTAKSVLSYQLAQLPAPAPGTALVVSVGGNDLLNAIYQPDVARDFGRRLDEVLARALERLQPARTLVANIYDPTGHDPSLKQWIKNVDAAMALLAKFNEAIATAARSYGATLVDLCEEFRRSAGSTPPWIVSRIEPSREGARQIARILREALAT